MTEINDGDTVRITFEGKAEKDTLGRVFVNDALLSPYRASSVEILEKRKPQVGDVAEGRDLTALPVGSLVTFGDEFVPIMRTHDGWVSTSGRQIETHNVRLPRVVVYIPSA